MVDQFIFLSHFVCCGRGAEQFSEYSGYGFKLRFAGDYVDTTPIVDDHVDVTIICIDAADCNQKKTSCPALIDSLLGRSSWRFQCSIQRTAIYARTEQSVCWPEGLPSRSVRHWQLGLRRFSGRSVPQGASAVDGRESCAIGSGVLAVWRKRCRRRSAANRRRVARTKHW